MTKKLYKKTQNKVGAKLALLENVSFLHLRLVRSVRIIDIYLLPRRYKRALNKALAEVERVETKLKDDMQLEPFKGKGYGQGYYGE